MRRRRKILLAGLLIVVALAAGVALVARRVVERSLSAAFSVPVAVGWLWWDPWTGQFSAGDVALGSGADLITAETVAFKADLPRILRGEIWIDRIEVEAPTAALRVGADNQVHFTAFGESAAGTAASSGPARRVFVREIAVSGGELIAHYPVGTGTRAATIEVGTFTASNLEIDTTPDGTQVSVSGALAGSVDGAPVEGNVEIRAGKERNIKGKLVVKGVVANREVLDLPPTFSTLTAKVDVDATIDFTDKRDALRLALRMVDPRFEGVQGTSFSARSITLSDAAVDITERAIDLGRVQVEAPVVTAVVADTSVVLPGVAGDDSTSTFAGPTLPDWAVTSKAIDVRGGEIRARGGDAALELILESARWEGLRGDRRGQLDVNASLADGGTIAITGALAADPLDARLDVTFEKVALVPLTQLAFSSPLHLAKGTAEGTIRVAFRDGLQELGGRAVLRDLATAPPDASRPVEVLAVHAVDFTVSFVPGRAGGPPASARIKIPILKLSYPYVMVHRHLAGTFPYSLIAGGASDAPATEPPRIEVQVDRMDIEGGKIEFVDDMQQPSYWASLTGVAAEVEEARYPEQTVARFEVTGRHDELSPADITGSVGAGGLEGRVKARDILLESLNAYVSPALGYALTSGRLSFDATLTPAPPLLQSSADVVLVGVDVLQTGLDVIQQQSGVPLPVAIGLLENAAGEIRLPLPFVIDTASGQISVGSVVWQAVRSAIAGALTYPLRALGNLFGTKGAPHAFAVDPIPFAPGRGSLDKAGTARVAAIARIVHAHRGLLLVLLPQVDEEDVRAVGADGAQALADARSAAVRDALVAGDDGPPVAADRVILAEWTPAKGAGATGRPGVYVELQEAAE